MLWLALHLNGLPLEAWLATAPGGDGRPCCVVEARHVVQADPAAAAQGVEPGMTAAAAASLAAGLQVFVRDPVREAALIERLALALLRFTPSVVLQRDSVLLEVSASLRLFGGARALWRAVREAALAAGVRTLRMAAASTATAASLLAQVEPPSPTLRRLSMHQRLDALPLDAVLAAWDLEPSLAGLLQGIGCRTLGDARRLPRAGLQRRGAAHLLDALARARGEAPDPQAWFEPPPGFEMELELLQRADDAAMLVFAAQRLVQPLAGWLARQWLAAARLTLLLRHETSLRHARPDTGITLALGSPSRDAAQIMLLLRERLQRAALPAPVYALALRLDQAVSHAGRGVALWRDPAGAAGGGDAGQLLDRLAARLGAERVLRPVLVADHRPEMAQKWALAQNGVVRSSRSIPDRTRPAEAPCIGLDRPDGGHGDRPAWLLSEPEPLGEEPGSGRPLFHGAPIVLATRAERIESGWFDGEPVCRDYHVAQAHDRRCLWVFRERRGEQSRWYLHGVFG
jgi:protein ImuB